MLQDASLSALLDNMITFSHKGNFEKTTGFLKKASESRLDRELVRFAKKGVEALASATPKDTGKTAASWYYTITRNRSEIKIVWNNSNTTDQAPVAVLIQYGHATRNGGYVQGIDYINPAMKPIADEISEYIRKELSSN